LKRNCLSAKGRTEASKTPGGEENRADQEGEKHGKGPESEKWKGNIPFVQVEMLITPGGKKESPKMKRERGGETHLKLSGRDKKT